MNDKILDLAKQADDYAWTQFPNTLEYPNPQEWQRIRDKKFAELVLQSVVSKIQVEGSDFYYNEPNDYGCITVKFFTGQGNPRNSMCGPEVMGNFVNGVRGTGRYRLTNKFTDYLLSTINESQN